MPKQYSTKTQSPSQNDPDQSSPKQDSRTKFYKTFGPTIEMNVHEDTRERLREIAEFLEGEDYAEKTRGLGSVYRKTVNDLINIFYIDCIFEARTKPAKALWNLYQENYELRVVDNLEKKERIKSLSLEFPSPTQLEKGLLTPSESKWKLSEIDKLDDHRWVINTLESLNNK
ncbi:hypothetical protein J8I88_09300 [Duffyella gerundensis]|uniref:hypothetical protein n=1 Tax=Duffyella gerundensis TaxID=1619313 RepID=UPI001AE25285|nr:hypothetical protein [Duffyella gerundensis]QTO52781.1 hypothetical protein J8I88_09300 [Duffyella gerundensis]